ncbi:DUF2255 family protein [Spirillospora sp. NPDC048911]|uniref:DUF2255 family protein n=1 Tax=Spirillospora sp. NPDC048911 TaxID=3364527 RepID=UPI00371F739F
MTGWTTAELTAIDHSDELELQSERADGTLRDPVTMWVVRDGDDLYVRPVKGRGGWYRGTRTRHRGRVSSGGVDKDVTFVDADTEPELNDALDTAYRTKYRAYADNIVGSVVNAQARGATLKLVPR